MTGTPEPCLRKSVAEIVEEYLKANRYDGLWNFDGECACKLGHLFPCGDAGIETCEAGYLKACCHGGEHDWDIGAKRDEVPHD